MICGRYQTVHNEAFIIVITQSFNSVAVLEWDMCRDINSLNYELSLPVSFEVGSFQFLLKEILDIQDDRASELLIIDT